MKKAAIKIVMGIVCMASCIIHLSYAQSTIRGAVTNEGGKPLYNINILLLHVADSSLVKGLVSDSAGSYSFNNIPPGKYILKATSIGFEPAYTPVYSIGENKDNVLVTEIRLKEEGKQLEKVTVTTKKPLFEQKMDRLVVNVRNSITSAGSTVLDVLERSPGVVVDRQNNVLSMGGKDGVVVMINGKETNMPASAIVQMLAGMNSANIERIELITTPPANFSAEGNGGFINIVLIENNSFGTNGSFTVSAGGGKGKMSSAALNFNHRKGKINLYGDYSFTLTKTPQLFKNDREFPYHGHIKESHAIVDRDTRIINFNGRMGLDYRVSKQTTIGATLSGYSNKWTMDAISRAYLSVDNQLDTLIVSEMDEWNRWKSVSANLNVQRILKKGGRLSANLDYLYYHNQNPNNYLNDYSDGSGHFFYNQKMKSDKITPIEFWVGSGDYTGKLGKNIELQAGVKHTRSGFNNEILVTRVVQNVWVDDKEFSADYELNENITAAYISLTPLISQQVVMKLGLRYEYTNSVLNTDNIKRMVDRHYGKLFPSFFISRKINDDNTINFSYSRRITRPSFNELAPFVTFLDPNTFVSGNPSLQASIADAVNASYSFKKYIFSLGYSYETGAITRFQTEVDPETNRHLAIPVNLKSLKILSLVTSIPLTITAWWSMQTNIIGRWQQVNSSYKKVPIQLEQKNIRITSTQSFKLQQDLLMDISGFYQSADLNGMFRRKPFGTLDFGIQKKIENNKGRLSFTITDILTSTRARSYAYIASENLETSRNNLFAQRLYKLTYSRTFGNSKLESKRRAESSEEERRRVE